jgi:hypothetical protein
VFRILTLKNPDPNFDESGSRTRIRLKLFEKFMHFVTKSGTKTSINDVQALRETYSPSPSSLNSKYQNIL